MKKTTVIRLLQGASLACVAIGGLAEMFLQKAEVAEAVKEQLEELKPKLLPDKSNDGKEDADNK